MRGDTADVIVQLSHCGTDGMMNWWVHRYSYVFAREGDGWRLQYPPRIFDSTDGHCGPEPPRPSRGRMPVAKDRG